VRSLQTFAQLRNVTYVRPVAQNTLPLTRLHNPIRRETPLAAASQHRYCAAAWTNCNAGAKHRRQDLSLYTSDVDGDTLRIKFDTGTAAMEYGNQLMIIMNSPAQWPVERIEPISSVGNKETRPDA
jgi:hypothetical protein